MALIRWKPFDELERMIEHRSWDLAVDVYEEGNNVIAKMHIPGIDPDAINIDIEEDHIHIYGKRENEKEVKEEHYYRKEICSGSFEREIGLPCSVQEDKAVAECKDGVLTITMPKASHDGKAGHKVKIVRK